MGCDGTYQALVKKIWCWNNGKSCSEIKSWEQNFDEEMEDFKKCLDNQEFIGVLGPAQCRSVGSTLTKPCKPGEKFWDIYEKLENVCRKETHEGITYLFKSDREHCKDFSCSKNKWSYWMNNTEEENCFKPFFIWTQKIHLQTLANSSKSIGWCIHVCIGREGFAINCGGTQL